METSTTSNPNTSNYPRIVIGLSRGQEKPNVSLVTAEARELGYDFVILPITFPSYRRFLFEQLIGSVDVNEKKIMEEWRKGHPFCREDLVVKNAGKLVNTLKKIPLVLEDEMLGLKETETWMRWNKFRALCENHYKPNFIIDCTTDVPNHASGGLSAYQEYLHYLNRTMPELTQVEQFALEAAEKARKRVKVYAIEKNPSAFVMYVAGGISIPASYTAFISPISSSKLYNEVAAYKDLAHFETPYVVMFQSASELAKPCQVWRFDHPNGNISVDENGWS
ncbi:18305_t:CDS:2 [Racocetra fulgida]|uniref:18305_t:CDS:1 n=1 Tax=Racocetra fulgida TaxID=60492 RepID=A0A9N8VGS6_9GLOM|nr:18305_t:CDS:2 [Racocetra fulgida]